MKAMPHSQSLPEGNTNQLNKGDEEGLNLGLVVDALRRRAFLVAGVTAVVAGGAAFKAITDVPVYQASFKILTEPVTVETQVISSVDQTLTSQQQEDDFTLDATKVSVLSSYALLSPLVEKLKAKYPDISYDTIQNNLNIQINEKNILEVSYKNTNRELVHDILELVSEEYLKYSLEERQSDIRQGIEFVEEQLPKLRSRVNFLQGELQQIRKNHNLIDPEIKGEQLSSQVKTFEEQLVLNEVELDTARNLYTDLQQELAERPLESATSTALKDNPRYQELLKQIYGIDSQVAKDSALLLENSKEIKILQRQRQNLVTLLRREAQQVERDKAARIRELEVRKQALTQNIDRLYMQLKQLSGIIRDYSDVQRELEIATNNLNQFLVTQEALRIDIAQRQLPWRLLSPITQPTASVASVKNNLILGALLGLMAGVGLALVLDQFNNLIYTSKEVRRIAQLPILGVIPYRKNLGEFAPAGRVSSLLRQLNGSSGSLNGDRPGQIKDRDHFLEAFRSLFANILLSGSEAATRSLVISSSTFSEGKSTVAAHLAQVAATIGQRILLVDTNLRYPRVHMRMGVMNQVGLADILSSEDIDFQDVIQRSPLESNLFVLTAGSIPLEPVRLLASLKMQDLMKKLQAAYDLVIYDAPPITGLADVNLLAVNTDGVVLVTGLGDLKRSLLEQALDQINISGIPILGIVVNKAKNDTYVSSFSYYHKSQKIRESRDEVVTNN